MTRPLNAESLRRLRKRFDLVPERMKDEARRVIGEAADAMVTEMKRAVDSRSGALADSIKAEKVDVEHAVRVRVTVGGPTTTKKIRAGVKDHHAAMGEGLYDYARAVEFGTITNAPEPFFRPTRDRHAKRLRFRLRATIKKALASMGSQT